MIVECLNIIDPNTNLDSNLNKDFGFEVGKKYLVIEIFVINLEEGFVFILYNGDATPLVANHRQFKIIDNKISSNWIIKFENQKFFLGPNKWLDRSLWRDSFWEDYHSCEIPEAEKCFQEEVALMIEESGFKEETR